MRGRKVGNTIVLDREPGVPDGTEVEVIFPGNGLPEGLPAADWAAGRAALLDVGCHPDFGADIGQAQQAWKPERF